jgi:hypothetical protein
VSFCPARGLSKALALLFLIRIKGKVKLKNTKSLGISSQRASVASYS